MDAAAVRVATRKDVPLLYWTAAAWASAITTGKDQPALIADLPSLGNRLIAAPDMWLAVTGSGATAILGKNNCWPRKIIPCARSRAWPRTGRTSAHSIAANSSRTMGSIRRNTSNNSEADIGTS